MFCNLLHYGSSFFLDFLCVNSLKTFCKCLLFYKPQFFLHFHFPTVPVLWHIWINFQFGKKGAASEVLKMGRRVVANIDAMTT